MTNFKTNAEHLSEIAATAAAAGKTLVVVRTAAEGQAACTAQLAAARGSFAIAYVGDAQMGLALTAMGAVQLTASEWPTPSDERALGRLTKWATKPL